MARPLPQPVAHLPRSAARSATSCSAGRSPTATSSSSAPRRRSMLASGFRPVGRDFPVFLHPETNEEYALARTERKHGRGYRGFEFFASPDVTLEEDLARRDLTINAMARGEDGGLIDPHGGAGRPARGRAAPRVAGVRRRSAARAARRALRGAPRLRGRAGNRSADARDRRHRANSLRWRPSASGRNWRGASWRRSRRGCSPCCANAARSRSCCRRSMRCSACAVLPAPPE